MQKQINIILEDLYQLDPSLRQHETQLIGIIQTLLVSRPDTKFDEAFAQRLRAQLLNQSPVQARINTTTFMPSIFNLKYFSYAAASLAVVVLAVVVWQNSGMPGGGGNVFTPRITAVGREAFGSLAQNSAGGVIETSGLSESVVSDADNTSLPTSSSVKRLAYGLGGGGGGGSDAMMIAPVIPDVRYVYGGDELQLEGNEIEVFRRVKSQSAAKELGNQLKGFDFGDVNLGSFSNVALQNVSFVEDKDFGYMVSFSLWEGVISINQNWERWPRPEQQCAEGDQRCYESLQLTPDSLPADDVLISIADEFILEKGIDMSAYARPVVDRTWITPEVRYIGDQISIIYPLLVDGQQVIEEGGQPSGISVSIDLRNRRVAGIWNYQSLQFESSAYAAETDPARIIRFAEQGGRYRPVYYFENQDNAGGTVTVTLGTPSERLVKIWQYSQSGGAATELLVPALVFPLVDKPANVPAWMQSVVVPLAKELLDEADRQNQNIQPPVDLPRPLPLTDELNSY